MEVSPPAVGPAPNYASRSLASLAVVGLWAPLFCFIPTPRFPLLENVESIQQFYNKTAIAGTVCSCISSAFQLRTATTATHNPHLLSANAILPTLAPFSCVMADLGAIPLVKHTIRDDGVALMELDRPTKRNALSQVMINQITSTLRSLDQDSKVRVVVLTGCAPNGPFCGMASMNED